MSAVATHLSKTLIFHNIEQLDTQFAGIFQQFEFQSQKQKKKLIFFIFYYFITTDIYQNY